MLKNAILAFICVFILLKATAQNEGISNWSVSGSITPNISLDYMASLKENAFSYGYRTYSMIKPAINLYLEYQPNNLVLLRGGVGYYYFDSYIYRSYVVPDNWWLSTYSSYAATIHYLEVPLIANFYLAKTKQCKFYVSIGDISSFEIAQTNIGGESWDLEGSPPVPGPIGTLAYQNYIQLGLGFEHKFSSNWSCFVNPIYRFALINYYTKGYENRTPSAAYQTLTGIELGAKYNFLKPKAG